MNQNNMDSKKVVIELQNVKREFLVGDEMVHALRGVSFKIYEGEFVTIMGKSGSGKSTLLNQLGCLDTPSSGEYLLDGIGENNVKTTTSSAAQQKNRFHIPELQSVTKDHQHRERRASPDVQLRRFDNRKT